MMVITHFTERKNTLYATQNIKKEEKELKPLPQNLFEGIFDVKNPKEKDLKVFLELSFLHSKSRKKYLIRKEFLVKCYPRKEEDYWCYSLKYKCFASDDTWDLIVAFHCAKNKEIKYVYPKSNKG